MKLLVFAHTPPPLHGQSYMVQLMLEGLGGDHRRRQPGDAPHPGDAHGIQCYHVNTRFSKRLEDIGEFHGIKLFRLMVYCLEAVWCRFRHGVTHFYYIPAPGKRSALYRDWMVMLLCHPFFEKIILHWEAAGLAKWLETSAQIRSRAITYHAYKPVDLSVVLSNYNMADAEKLLSRNIRVVNNGIADPCPDFAETLLPRSRARRAARAKLFAGESLSPPEITAAGGDPELINVLFLANGLREKGPFAALRGVVAANRTLAASQRKMRMRLVFAGNFVTDDEREEFDRLHKEPEFAAAVNRVGFVSGAEKLRVLREADLFCFPTLYLGENQPVCLIEAMAFGLPIVTTRWRSLPEMLPPNYPGLVNGHDPDEIAGALLKMAALETSAELREVFLSRFSLDQYLTGMAAAIRSVEKP